MNLPPPPNTLKLNATPNPDPTRAASAESLIGELEQRIAGIQAERQAVEQERQAFTNTFEQTKALPNLNRLANSALAAAHQGMGPGARGGGVYDYDDDEMDGLFGPGGPRKFGGGGGGSGRFKRNRQRETNRPRSNK